MGNSDEENSNFEAFKFYKPKKASDYFINYYIFNYKNESKKKELEKISEGISRLGLDRVLEIYSSMEKKLQLNVKKENYEIAGELKKVMDYFKENVIDKVPMP